MGARAPGRRKPRRARVGGARRVRAEAARTIVPTRPPAAARVATPAHARVEMRRRHRALMASACRRRAQVVRVRRVQRAKLRMHGWRPGKCLGAEAEPSCAVATPAHALVQPLALRLGHRGHWWRVAHRVAEHRRAARQSLRRDEGLGGARRGGSNGQPRAAAARRRHGETAGAPRVPRVAVASPSRRLLSCSRLLNQ